MSGRTPPRGLERVVGWALPSGLAGQSVLGDLAEEFDRRAMDSPFRARLWYAAQALSIVVYSVLTGSGAESSMGNSDLAMDVRWSLRSALKHPGFSLGVVAVLGLGLAANVAVFAVVDGTFQNTSWWSDPDATVAIWPERQFSYGQLDMYAEEQTVYGAVGGYAELAFAVRMPDGESESVNGVSITPELFGALAVQPILGRALRPEDGEFGSEPVVVIGEALWRRSFGADPSIVGRRIDLSGASVTVVGVQGAGGMAPGGRAEIWLPWVLDPRDDDFWKAQGHTWVGVLRDGATIDDAFVELQAFNERLSRLFPMFYPPGFSDGLATISRADEAQRRMISTPLLLLLGGTALLMLVTALNVGNLLLGRAIQRRKEMAVRAALGASGGRIVKQLLVEGTVLTILAIGVGITAGSFGGQRIADLFVGEAVVVSSSVLSPSVLAFALALSLLAWMVLNGVPVVHFFRTQKAGLTVAPSSASGMHRSLVMGQAALATLLLVAATLLVATVANLRDVPLGFDPGGLVAVELSPPETTVETVASARGFYDGLVERVAGLPGVEAVGLTGWLPLDAQAPTTPINLQSAPVDPAQAVKAPKQMVDPGFFEAFGVVPLAGRSLGTEDRAAEPSAVVVNETLADMLWPDGAAVGQMIAIDPHAWDTWVTVVGVIPDIRSGEIAGPTGPALYIALAESPARDVSLVVRTGADPVALLPALTRTVGEVNPLVPIRSVNRMEDVVRRAYSTSWVVMGLLIVLAVLATGLGAIGIYAVLAHHVAASQKELSVRLALGAQPVVLVGAVVRSGVGLALVGIAVGSVVAAASTRFLESLLFGVSALAPWAFLPPALALAFAALLAAVVPAVRVGSLPPAQVLRGD